MQTADDRKVNVPLATVGVAIKRIIQTDCGVDLGVRDESGLPYVRVDCSHKRLKSGQYTFEGFSTRRGEYKFSTVDVFNKRKIVIEQF